MKDAEIIKALQICTSEHLGCEDGCPFINSNELKYRGGYACAEKMRSSALDLLNRQQAEIERLTLENLQMVASIKNLKAEAIKEFAERLKAKAYKYDRRYYTTFEIVSAVDVEYIDKLVKEMVGDKNDRT